MPVTERMIDLGAVTLAVDEAGAGGRPLLLLHGFTGNKNDFDPVTEPLAERGWHVVAPDHRGHGKSSKPAFEPSYSIESFMSDAFDLIVKLGWDDCVVLGHSMGGMIAQALAVTAPRRVSGLILMDTSHTNVSVDPVVVQMGLKIARDEGIDAVADAQNAVDDPLATPAHQRLCDTVPGYKERGEANLRVCSADMFAAMLLEITEPHDRIVELASIACPTLVIVGEQDEPFIEPSRRMADVIPNARLEILPDAGHSPQFEAPDAWWAAVGPFLDELSGEA